MIAGLLSLLAGALAALPGFAVHSPAGFFVLLALLAAPVLFYHVMLGRRAQSRSRTRALRWRSRLWLRPGAGFASLAELVTRWGRLAAVFHGRRARPGLGFWARAFSPVTGYAVR